MGILRCLKSWFNVLPLDQAVQRIRTDTLPERAAAITFDDGYADNFTVALPLLLEARLTATFFVATGFLDGGRMWNDTVIEAIRHCRRTTLDLEDLDLGSHILDTPSARRKAIDTVIDRLKYLPDGERIALAERIVAIAAVTPTLGLMMTSQNVSDMRGAGMQIGAHTVSHAILTRLTLKEARREITEGKEQLEKIVGERVGLFAYPNGKFSVDYAEEHAVLVRDVGFDAAVSTDWGAATRDTDFMRLPRFTPWDRSQFRFGVRLATNLLPSFRGRD